jgi:predicted nuclease of predicted toxin-antitoxin system
LKVLLDENIPHNLRRHLPRHEVTTVAHKGWGGLKNGDLLTALERAGFDVFVTGDQGIEYQNRIAGRRFGIVALSTNNWPIIRKHLNEIAAAVEVAQAGSVSLVDCGKFTRVRNPRTRE